MSTTHEELGEPLVPYPFQEADIQKLAKHGWSGFVVAETGAGKSLIGTETALRSGAEVVLVIAPKGTHGDVWRDGIMRQSRGKIVPRIIKGGTKGGTEAWSDLQLGEPGWYIITPNLFTLRDWKGITADLTILDEAHLLANRDSKGWKKLNKFKSAARIVMSGTIVRNRVENFWGLLRWVYPEFSGSGELSDISFRRWVKWDSGPLKDQDNYMLTKKDHFAPAGYVIVGEKEPGRIAREIPCYIQHFKRAECCEFHPEGFLEGLPAPINITREVELSPKQKYLIERVERDYMVWLDQQADTLDPDGKNRRKALVVKLPVVMQTRLRQMSLGVPSFDADGSIYFAPGCESPKLDDLHSRLRETGDEPYVVLTSSEKFATEAVRRMNEDWKIPAAKWAGTITQKARDQAKADLTAGRIRVIVGVIEAISTGIDGLQLAASNLYWLERSRDLTANIQSEGRLDRRGQKRQVVNEEVVANGSMDRGVISAQLKKRMALNASLQKKLAREERERRNGEKS